MLSPSHTDHIDHLVRKRFPSPFVIVDTPHLQGIEAGLHSYRRCVELTVGVGPGDGHDPVLWEARCGVLLEDVRLMFSMNSALRGYRVSVLVRRLTDLDVAARLLEEPRAG